jgi:hypothetical protein
MLEVREIRANPNRLREAIRLLGAGFTPIVPPLLVRERSLFGMSHFPSAKRTWVDSSLPGRSRSRNRDEARQGSVETSSTLLKVAPGTGPPEAT